MQRKPEIEDVILSILINKLGDNSKKVQLHAVMVLCRVLKNHPQMAFVFIHETHLLLQRPGCKQNQRLVATHFLNKISALASKTDEKVRVELFRIYFSIFKTVIKNPQEVKEEIFKKDRTKSKKEQIKAKIKAMKKLK